MFVLEQVQNNIEKFDDKYTGAHKFNSKQKRQGCIGFF